MRLNILNLKTGQMAVYTTSQTPGNFTYPTWVNNHWAFGHTSFRLPQTHPASILN